MLGNCEKMLLISSSPPPNEWPQNIINPIDNPEESTLNNNNNNNPNMASLTATATNPTGVNNNVDHHHHHHHHQKVDHQHQHQHQQQKHQESLKCPRCDSTNTKFCYYNNYSLSQPRHFCKACKRYWTRGGTLRNVPVGGGCRKNKRVKRATNNSSSSSITTTTSLNSANNNNNINNEGSVNSGTSSSVNNSGPIHELISSGSNPLFYGFPASNTMNFPFSRYDLQNPHQINGLGLGFSSGLVHNMSSMNIHHHSSDNNDNNNNNNKQIFQELMSSNPLLSHYATTTTTTGTTTATTTGTTTTTPPPTISTLLGSTLHQMKGGQTILPSYEGDLHMKGSGNNGMFIKEVKMEFQGTNRSFDTNHHWDTTNTTHNQMDHHHQPMGSSNDPSIIWGATTGANLGAWLDPSNNLGSSVPSLI